jgi:23S rRNA pseudouridine1911/1915/1917 synthase
MATCCGGDKPAGLVHPGNGNPDGTLLNALLHHQANFAALLRAGSAPPDRDTSGLLVVAKTLTAQPACVAAAGEERAT